MSRWYGCPYCIESCHDIVEPSLEESSIGQHDVDFVGTICETSMDQRNDLGRLITSSREVDDGRDGNSGSFELLNRAGHESRPDAHRSHIPVRPMRSCTQPIDVGFGARLVEVREIDETENSPSESASQR
jgi:hypothetical protein